MKELRTEVEIDAPPHRVWAVLSDFARHPEWNPFVRSIEGELREGARLSVRLRPPGGKVHRVKPTVLRAVQDVELRWRGRLVLPRIFDGEHIFQLEPKDSGQRTRFIQREKFRGLLVPLFSRSLDTDIRRGFEAMNEALKERAEAPGQRNSRVRVHYAIVFVSDMKRAVSFYRDTLGLPLRFESPGWTEFATDGAILALHASDDSGPDRDDLPAGRCRPGLSVPDLDEFHRRMMEEEVRCLQAPHDVFGSRVAQYADPDGLAISVGEEGRGS